LLKIVAGFTSVCVTMESSLSHYIHTIRAAAKRRIWRAMEIRLRTGADLFPTTWDVELHPKS
jgi:hypothetical protein